MAKTIQTLSPEFIREVAWAVEQVKRLRPGELHGDVPDVAQAPDDLIIMTPSEGLPARDGATIYGESSSRYVQSAPSAGSSTLSALVDGTSAPIPNTVYCAEEVPMGGLALWSVFELSNGKIRIMHVLVI